MDDGPARIRLVCFDLGGVIVRICGSWREGCVVAGLPEHDGVPPELDHDTNAAYQRGTIDADAFAERFSASMGGRYAPDEILQVHRAWLLGEYEGVGALVERVHAAGVETAVLSNTCAVHWETMGAYPTFRALRNRFGSHRLGLRKPDAAAYRAVETGTGYAACEILFFDDTPENVDAARAVGWAAERIRPETEPAEQMMAVLGAYGVI